jgi:predicted transcriptional regulator
MRRDFTLAFEKILHKLEIIDAKVSRMPEVQVSISSRLLPTLVALKRLKGCATATQISQITGRQRAVESGILNELWRMGLLDKEKQGAAKIFTIRDEHAQR